jgi:hypothetical protein
MVQNKKGGSGGKKVARKNVGGGNASSQDVRRITDPGEMYAVVSKIYSNRRCDVIGTDGNTYNCNVRGKFLKGRRGNASMAVGVWLMVGFYEWEVRSDGSKNCDLLEIYTAVEKDKLRQLEGRKLDAIMHVGDMTGTENDCTFSNFHIEKDTEKGEADEEEESSSEEDNNSDDDIKKGKKAVVAAVPIPPQKKETSREQMDWLAVDERDI